MITQLRQAGDRLRDLLLGDSRGIAPVPVALAALEMVDRNGNPVLDTWKVAGALWQAPGANVPRGGSGGALVWDFARTGPHMMVRRSTAPGSELPWLSYQDGRTPAVPPVGSILTLTLWNDTGDDTWNLSSGDGALQDADILNEFDPGPIAVGMAQRYTFQVFDDAVGVRRLYTRGSQAETISPEVGAIQAGSTAVGDVRWRASLSLQPGWIRCNGQAISRTTYLALLGAITISATGNKSNGSPIITSMTTTAGMGAGQAVEGNGIPAATTIASVNSATQITLSANCTATSTGTAVGAYPFGAGDGSTTFNVPDLRGRAVAGYDPGNSQARLGATNAGILGVVGGLTVLPAQSDLMILAAEIYTGVVT